MCFSAKASFISSGILALIGAATLYKGRGKKVDILGCIPLIFAAQQAAEGIIWNGFNSGFPYALSCRICAYFFVFCAYIFWPIATPALLYRFEKNPHKKQRMSYALFSGVTVALMSLVGAYTMGIEYKVVHHHIVYSIATPVVSEGVRATIYGVGLALYAFATIGALCISTIPDLWIFTSIVATGFAVSLIFYYLAFTSIWCFFAALASCALYVIVVRNNKQNH